MLDDDEPSHIATHGITETGTQPRTLYRLPDTPAYRDDQHARTIRARLGISACEVGITPCGDCNHRGALGGVRCRVSRATARNVT